MDDRELEARISQRVHDRFDAAPIPMGLETAVRRAMALPAPRVGFTFRPRAFQLGWTAVATAIVVGVIALAGGRLGPAGPRSTPTPPATAAPPTERFFVVLPRELTLSKEELGRASVVLEERLRALGYGTFSTFNGFALGFEVPLDGPADDVIKRVLVKTGDVEVVPLTAADYGTDGPEALVGTSLANAAPALFGWDGIESVSLATDQQAGTTLVIKLKPAAWQAVADYTTAHTGEYMAVVLDGSVVAVPAINEPISGGEIAITPGGAPGSKELAQFMEWAAVLVGGILPESWRGATSPTLLTTQQAIEIALSSYPTGTVGGTNLYFAIHGYDAEPVWSVSFTGNFPFECGDQEPSTCPEPATFAQVLMDAVTGGVIMPTPLRSFTP